MTVIAATRGGVRSAWRRRILTVIGGAAVACTEPHAAIPFPTDAHEIGPAAPYARWWAMTESCSGRSGSLAAVRFYTIPEATLEGDGASFVAYWFEEGNRIVFVDGRSMNGATVRHEMLHALLGTGEHPRADFVDRCGGIVAFGDPVHEEASALLAPPTANSPVLIPADFAITLAIAPTPVALAQPDSGWVTAIVSVANPRDEPVWVRIPRPVDLNAGSTLGVEIDDGATRTIQSRYSVDTLVPFGAREVKRQAVDVQLTRGLDQWRMRGLFSTDSTAWQGVVIAP